MWKPVSTKFLIFCTTLCGLPIGVLLYGDFRADTFGFNLTTSAETSFFVCLLPSLVVLPVVLIVSALSAMEQGIDWRDKWRGNPLIILVFVAALFEGGLCTEYSIVQNEKAFTAQVAHHRAKYGRNREGLGQGSLWFSPQDGFWEVLTRLRIWTNTKKNEQVF